MWPVALRRPCFKPFVLRLERNTWQGVVEKMVRERRYCQKLWMGLAQAASFLMPSTKGTPLMTSTIN